MIPQEPVLFWLLMAVDRIPEPPSGKRGRGRPCFYLDRLFLKALLFMIIRRIHTVHGLLAVLAEPAPEMQRLRALFVQAGRFPTRRTWERRLHALPATLPARIGCLGRHLLALLRPWAEAGRAVALDSTALRARGGVWHKKDREAGTVPHTSIDTEAHWTKSGWHGWIYGWKLHLLTTVAAVWIPLAAALTPANAADNEVGEELLRELPAEVRFLLGDQHYNAPNIRARCEPRDCMVIASQPGKYPHQDEGVELRRFFHELRSRAIENFNGQFKGIFEANAQVPTRGLVNTQRFVLGAVLLYQLVLLYRFEHDQDLRVGLKAFLKAA